MLYPRLIPSLLVNSKRELVKTIKFSKPKYLGEPLNTAFIFSGFEADELIVLDIDASKNKKCISLNFVESLSSFTNVPLTIGGGISNLEQIHKILSLGVERVALSNCLSNDFTVLNDSANIYGSSSIAVIINTFKNEDDQILGSFGRPDLCSNYFPIKEICKECQESGAGEIIINQIDHEGTRKGFDTKLMKELNQSLSIPLVALGGCGKIEHIHELLKSTPISGISCGSFFVYSPDTSEVLLSYDSASKWLKNNFEKYINSYKK